MKLQLLWVLLCGAIALQAQVLRLPSEWKFSLGDSKEWKGKNFDDQKWKTIQLSKPFEMQGYEGYDGIAWYRTRIVLNDSLKQKKYLIFSLGKIDDEDQVFLNGKLIGQNNRTAEPSHGDLFNPFSREGGLWETNRIYILSVQDSRIEWNKENSIAIRVHDISGNGGIIASYSSVLASDKYEDPTMREQKFAPYIWPSEIPAGCPFSPSSMLKGVAFLGYHTDFYFADTWYPSWASDDKLYSPYTDGSCIRLDGGRDVSGSGGEFATTGQAVIEGNDPLNLKVYSLGTQVASSKPYEGRYPCGSLVHNGIWYYGTYCLDPSGGAQYGDSVFNWPWLGPFVGFRISTNFGRSWTACPKTPSKPLFGENGKNGYPVKIGSPHFVDFGKNMEHSPDGKAYLVAHGADLNDKMYQFYNASWITGDQIYLIRVTPSIETINDSAAYEFFAGYEKNGRPVWTNDFKKIKPMLEWNNNMGCVTITYNPVLKKYLMCVTDGENTVAYMHTYILESDAVTGPWKIVTYMKNFGQQAYFVNIPSKFISPDGYTMWLCYSGNFASDWNGMNIREDPPGSHYGLVLQKMELLTTSTIKKYPIKK